MGPYLRLGKQGPDGDSTAAELVTRSGCDDKCSQGRNRKHGSRDAYLHRGASYRELGVVLSNCRTIEPMQ